MLFDPLNVLSDFGDFFESHQDSLLFPFRRCGGAQHAQASRDILGDASLRSDDCSVADMNVIDDSGLAGNHDIVARSARTGDADLAHEKVVAANSTIVADLYQVVDFRAFADPGGLERAAIDGRAGTYLDVVANLDVT